MVSVYNDADYLAVYKQKQKIFWVFMAVTLCYVAFCAAWLIYFISLPYEAPMQALPKWLVFIVTALYVIFAYPYLAIKFSRVRRYYKMLSYVSLGLKSEEKNYFYCFEEQSLQKDNIDVMGCVFETWNEKKQEWLDRVAHWDVEKPLPPFEEGDYTHYVLQSNFVVQYGILQKQVLEFEEVED